MTTACRLLWLWVLHEKVGYNPVEGGACAVVRVLGHLVSGSSFTKTDQEPVRSVQSGLWAAQDAENGSFQADSRDLQMLQSLASPASLLWALGWVWVIILGQYKYWCTGDARSPIKSLCSLGHRSRHLSHLLSGM